MRRLSLHCPRRLSWPLPLQLQRCCQRCPQQALLMPMEQFQWRHLHLLSRLQCYRQNLFRRCHPCLHLRHPLSPMRHRSLLRSLRHLSQSRQRRLKCPSPELRFHPSSPNSMQRRGRLLAEDSVPAALAQPHRGAASSGDSVVWDLPSSGHCPVVARRNSTTLPSSSTMRSIRRGYRVMWTQMTGQRRISQLRLHLPPRAAHQS